MGGTKARVSSCTRKSLNWTTLWVERDVYWGIKTARAVSPYVLGGREQREQQKAGKVLLVLRGLCCDRVRGEAQEPGNYRGNFAPSQPCLS